jgi:predicted transcriptional regulator
MADVLLLPSELAIVKQRLIYVSSSSNAHEILQVFSSNNVASLPVWDEERKCWLGIIDMLDVIWAHGMLDWSATTLDMRELFDRFQKNGSTARTIVDQSPRSKRVIFICPGESLLSAMHYLTESHRILIGPKNATEPSKFHLLSQMDIVRQLAKSDLGIYSQRKIEELFPPKDVCHVLEDDIARDAFQIMFEKNLGALAVVNKEGILTATLSTTDLKSLNFDTIGNIMLPVKSFLLAAYGMKPAVPIVAKPHAHLEDLLPKLLIAKVHRVWTTNSAERPTGVITLSDIIKLLTGSPPVSS